MPSFSFLPTIAENLFTDYISGNFSSSYVKATPEGNVTGNYSVTQAFSVEPFSVPAVVISAGKFKEVEPWTHVYEGELSLGVITQVDDCANPVAVHDATVSQIYDLMSNQTGVYGALNGSGFHLWNYYQTNLDQAVAGSEGERTIHSILEYRIHCQGLGLS
jgi:hypothetical protein